MIRNSGRANHSHHTGNPQDTMNARHKRTDNDPKNINMTALQSQIVTTLTVLVALAIHIRPFFIILARSVSNDKNRNTSQCS